MQARRIPVATYRLQLRREFPFAAAEAVIAHAHAFGISDYYVSPILLSTPGSSHGYDVTDYRLINPELGGREGFSRLHDALRARQMGLVLDFVPNHMGINAPGLLNTWWRDVLQNGVHSRYAGFFDIDWSGTGEGAAQVLVPILDDHYGRVLEAGRLALRCERGVIGVHYGDMQFPVRPQTYQSLLNAAAESMPAAAQLRELAEEFGALPRAEATEDFERAAERTKRVAELKRRLGTLLEQQPAARAALEERLHALEGRTGEPRSFDALDEVISQQHYRLAYWRAGQHETNYRRFFAIDTLIGLRMEEPEVFEETHALLSRLLVEGTVTGLRIDHIDGLRQPQRYLERLQALAMRTGDEARDPLYVLVEKILADHEPLPVEWPTHGTTGYEFIAQIAGVLVDPQAERYFSEHYAEFTGETAAFEDVVYQKKLLVLEELFANAVLKLATDLTDLVRSERRWRDVSRNELTVAVREVMAAHGVYRTYRRGPAPMEARDRRVVEQASAIAIARNPRLGAAPIELVRDVLTGDFPPEDPAEAERAAQPTQALRARLADWVLSFQQYTGAIMAKAVEDTAFYTYSRFIALNEVGGNPGRFGGTVAGFHAANEERLRRTPHALLALATHDTKLGEDARARLYALSELPHEWHESLQEWRQMNQRHKTMVDGRAAPDANEEYRLYQILLAAWPADDADPDDGFRERIREHLRKAVNEAKRNTTWVQPNERWIEAGDRFVDALLSLESGREFLASFRPRAGRLAHLGLVNTLTQTVLKITSPGVPDFYQGTELWDLSLVDPDNRRPVDFDLRSRLTQKPLDGLRWAELFRDWRSGEIKLQIARALLQFRGTHRELFQQGEYWPLQTRGRFRDKVVAFARVIGEEAMLVVAPRLTSALGCPPLGLVWDDTTLVLPTGGGKRWRDVVTGCEHAGEAGELRLSELLAELPFAVLASG
ncbi:malto-oligosyltrehalose synthase [Opitutus terrae PB90-1]|uniref:Malto-oligosyltrehalose synthase n=2 Tax=Opitutus terrae TaxID=107709 RepID=B1ZYQ9_OPITP|nr:malto-oligosyltrehalose synthase [Opitutus terrae PB90-1]